MDDTPLPTPTDADRLHAVNAVRQALSDWKPGQTLDAAALAATLDAHADADSLFARGWLHWLAGDFPAAEPPLVEAVAKAEPASRAEAAYWLARVRLLLGQGDAVADFESVLRRGGAPPRATCWFVDLLWRSGNADRAEQVWKTVRLNARVTAADEAPLIEARSLLRRGEASAAERVLGEASPRGGVVRAERDLLLAWALAALNQHQHVVSLLRQAETGLYPRAAVAEWQAHFLRRQEGSVSSAIEGLRSRRASSGELLEHLDRAAAAGCRPPNAEAWRGLARLLSRGSVSAAELGAVVDGAPAGPARRNALRGATELVGRLAPAEAVPLLTRWASEQVDDKLRQSLGEQLLRALLRYMGEGRAAGNAIAAAESLLGPCPALTLARVLLDWRAGSVSDRRELPDAPPVANAPGSPVLLGLCSATLALTNGGMERWRTWLHEVAARSELQTPIRLLLLHNAAERRDPDAVADALDDRDAWAALPSPPVSAARAASHALRCHPAATRLKVAASRWLALWERRRWPPEAMALAVRAGVLPPDPRTAEPPDGIPPAAWFLHQAALATSRREFSAALLWTRRALEPDPNNAAARDALPELEAMARTEALALVARAHPEQPAVAAELLADAVRLIDAEPEGKILLDAAAEGDLETARSGLIALAQRDKLPPELAHHLALLWHRAAVFAERRDDAAAADRCWPLAWRCWLAVLADLPPDRADLLLGRLLGQHRERLGDLLARGAMERARRHWELVHGLPALARGGEIVSRLEQATASFRDELAAEYLTATHETMRHGAAPAGWRADYDGGLAALRRLLSLDGDNVRLLTALVETCGEWFFDCYNNEAPIRLVEGVKRFTPFALKLARRVEARPAELAARAALAEFYKYRAIVAAERAAKIAIYREALRFNPANVNVRELLAEQEHDDGVYRP